MDNGEGNNLVIPKSFHDGYRQFRTERYAQEIDRYRAVAQGQKPKAMVIGCIDSRVDPATIFSAGPGELLVLRNIAALVPSHEEVSTCYSTSAALEFAVCALRIPNIVVLGHGKCGGIEASLTSKYHGSIGCFIDPWIELLADLRDEVIEQTGVEADRQKALEHAAIRQSLENMGSFSFIADAVNEGRLTLDGAWFSISDGELLWLNAVSQEFEPVSE